MPKFIEITDDVVTEVLAKSPRGYDSCSDAANYPSTFLKGYRDAEEGKYEPESHYSMAEGNAYDLGQYEWKES